MTMSVTAKSNDVAGTLLDTQNSALTTAIAAAAAGSVQLAQLTAAQKALNDQMIQHHLQTGRLIAATVLGASLYGAHGTTSLFTTLNSQVNDAVTLALYNATTTLSANIPARGAAGWQSYNETQSKLLDQNQRELLAVCI